MSFVGNPDQFRAHVSKLPAWNESLEDDPNWVRPTEEVTGRAVVPHDANMVHSTKLLNPDAPPPLRQVPVDQIRQTQHQINLMAVRHYVDHGPNAGKLFDPDGWLGTEHPVIVEHPVHGHVIADGNSRFTAALIRGNKNVGAHVLPAGKPEHVAATQAHMDTSSRLYAEHDARVAPAEAKHGKGWLARDAHPELVQAHRASQAILRPALKANDELLARRLAT